MSIEALIPTIIAGVLALGGIVTLLIALFRGKVKEFIKEKMYEAEQSGKTGAEKLKYVLEELKKQYKLAELFLNCKKFIDGIIDISKHINAK